MKTQAQYKVIGEIWETVQFYVGELYSDMSVSFLKQPKRSRS